MDGELLAYPSRPGTRQWTALASTGYTPVERRLVSYRQCFAPLASTGYTPVERTTGELQRHALACSPPPGIPRWSARLVSYNTCSRLLASTGYTPVERTTGELPVCTRGAVDMIAG